MSANSTNQMIKYAAVAIVFAVVLYSANLFGFLGGQPTAQAAFQPSGAPSTAATSLRSCQQGTTITLNAAGRNYINTSTQYLASAFKVVPTGDTVSAATGTGTAGSTLTYTAVAIPCEAKNFEGTLYAAADSTNNGAFTAYSISGTGGSKILQQTQGDELRITLRDTTLRSISANQTEDPTEEAATAMNAGDTRTGYIDVDPPNFGFSAYGSNNAEGEGIVWIVDTVDAAAFSDNAVSVSSTTGGFVLKLIDCNKYAKEASTYSGNRCYVSRGITSGDGLIRLSYTVAADGGAAPGSTSDPTINVVDLNWFENTDGTMRFGGTNAAGTDQGQSTSVITLDNS